jgi:DUF4097 and DUF4098 domain-containing protein YvlB
MSWFYTVLFAGLAFSPPDVAREAGRLDVPQAEVAAIRVQDETEKFEQTYPLNPNGRVRLSNVNGSVVVEAWDKNEIHLSYTKVADSKERLADVEIRISSRPDFFSVESDYDNLKARNSDQWRNDGKLVVEYRLMVPRGAVLNEIETVNGSVTVSNFTNVTRVSAVNGSVKASNIRGTARLSTVNGEVNADFDKLEPGTKISLDTVNGRVHLLIPSDSNATLKADSLNGSITNDFGLPVRKGKYVGRDLYGKIGSGDVDIKLNSVNGPLSVGRKSDGKALSPAVNLLPKKEADEENWDGFNRGIETLDTDKLNREVAKAVKESTKTSHKALADTKLELDKMGPELARIAADSVESAAKAIRPDLLTQMGALPRIGDISFFPAAARMEKKSDSIPVKGTPTVSVDAKGCSVSVRGWDKNEVQYRVTQFSSNRENKPLDIKERHSESTVSVTVNGENNAQSGRMFLNQNHTRIEVFVPRKANLKIDASGEIRIEGVSGDVQLNGSDSSINVRDVNGKLRVNSMDGRVRVVGFSGDIDVQSQDGSINLEGDFRSLKARSSEGAVTLTLPENVSASLTATCDEVESDGLEVTRVSQEEERSLYQIGKGGPSFEVSTAGKIQLRAAAAIRE